MNGYHNVKVCPIALSNRGGSVELFLDKGLCGSFAQTEMFKNRIVVRQVRFDTLAIKEGIKKVDVVKIDVEGAEYMVIEGMQRILSSIGDITIFCEIHPEELHKMGYEVEVFFDLLENLGFDVKIIEESGELSTKKGARNTGFHIIAAK